MQKNAVIMFEPDGYVTSGPKLMGRHAAGNAFLRAAVAGREGENLSAYTPHRASAEVFARMVSEFDPAARATWSPAERLDLLRENGTLYVPQPELAGPANLRLRAGPAAYSITGITHTTASHSAMDSIAALLEAPVMPWDAVICTSQAVVSTVQQVLQAQLETMRWRSRQPVEAILPQFPVIPLGVHVEDYQFDAAARQQARGELGVAEDEVVALFVGRLSFHAKAHPLAMYQALQQAARRSGKKVTLVQLGWFANEQIELAFKSGAELGCPDVRCVFLDGREPTLRQRGWAGADLFISLSDNIQETFGLTPIEAMAAGLPVVVSDWDGYKDTVSDGEVGYRIPTWYPQPGLGEVLAERHEAAADNYDLYCGLNCVLAPVDIPVLVDRLAALIVDPVLRRRLGEEGRRQARERFDWSVIYSQYKALWSELGKMRQQAIADPKWQEYLAAAPKVAAARQDPFKLFAHYPTSHLVPATLVESLPGASVDAYRQWAQSMMFSFAKSMLPAEQVVKSMLAVLEEGGATVAVLATKLKYNEIDTIAVVAILAKMGLVRLS